MLNEKNNKKIEFRLISFGINNFYFDKPDKIKSINSEIKNNALSQVNLLPNQMEVNVGFSPLKKIGDSKQFTFFNPGNYFVQIGLFSKGIYKDFGIIFSSTVLIEIKDSYKFNKDESELLSLLNDLKVPFISPLLIKSQAIINEVISNFHSESPRIINFPIDLNKLNLNAILTFENK